MVVNVKNVLQKIKNKMENNEIKIEENNTPKSRLNIPSAIILAGVIVASAIFLRGATPATTTGIAEGGDDLSLVSEVTEDDFVRGDKNAPITLIEYADFSCSFCAKFQLTLKKLVDESEGKIKWVYRHLPIFNLEAAVASSCVGKLGGENVFWQYSDILFANQDKLNNEYYFETAKSLDIDETKYQSCIDDKELKSKITTEFTRNKVLLGFNGTPHTVLVDKDGRKFSFTGALPENELKSVLESIINR